MTEDLIARPASERELAELLGLSERQIRRLVKDGVLIRLPGTSPTFEVAESFRRYLASVRERKVAPNKALDRERIRKWRLEADKTALNLGLMRNKLHLAKVVEAFWNDRQAAYRARTLAIPVKCAGLVLSKSSLVEVVDILEKAIYEALNELSEYNPDPLRFENLDLDLQDQELERVLDNEPSDYLRELPDEELPEDSEEESEE